MKPPTCRHLHGARVEPLMAWVCGQCFAKLEQRPTRYGMVRNAVRSSGYLQQQIVWQAEIRKSEHDLTLADFLRTMAKRFIYRCREPMVLADAVEMARIELEALGDEWLDPAYDWSHAGARDMADESMQYWDHEEAQSNGQA